MNNDFAVFILTHGRPKKIKTLKTLLKLGYTGDYYIIIDSHDPTAEEHYKLYGDKVITFDKDKYIKETDTMDNFGIEKVVVYARNAVWDIAEKMGYKYILELDDDYDGFYYRYGKNEQLKSITIYNGFDDICKAYLDFLKQTGAHSVCFSQNGDYIGGIQSGLMKKKVIRKAMNGFFFDISKRLEFIGTLNDDVNFYTYYGSQGCLFFTISGISINQPMTQSVKGGATDIYIELGTYVKSFYSVILNPSSVKISTVGNIYPRIHHRIDWNSCVPCIINEKYKKK